VDDICIGERVSEGDDTNTTSLFVVLLVGKGKDVGWGMDKDEAAFTSSGGFSAGGYV
jgi:hypothetical protein